MKFQMAITLNLYTKSDCQILITLVFSTYTKLHKSSKKFIGKVTIQVLV